MKITVITISGKRLEFSQNNGHIILRQDFLRMSEVLHIKKPIRIGEPIWMDIRENGGNIKMNVHTNEVKDIIVEI